MPQFFINLFTANTWQEAGAIGYTVTGFNEYQRSWAPRVNLGDIFICYLAHGGTKFVGALRVASDMYYDESRIWSERVFPVRFAVDPIATLDPADGLSIKDMPDLEMYSSNSWRGIVRSSLHSIVPEDGELLVSRLIDRANEVQGRGPGTEGVAPEPRLHRVLQDKLSEIGSLLGKHAQTEYREIPHIYDVVWKESERLPRASHVFEVQDRGNLIGALAKLQHARDVWGAKLFLLVTGEGDRRRVEQHVYPLLNGTFHGLSPHLTVLSPEQVNELHGVLSRHSEVLDSFFEN